MYKCSLCGHVFDWTEGFEDIFGDTVCPICGNDDCNEEDNEKNQENQNLFQKGDL